MPTNKNLRTPIIKPRTVGGTFYTFGSAMEDIGLNINDNNTSITLSHYALLNIPDFDPSALGVTKQYSGEGINPGDYTFADFFQNCILNAETTIRNTENYDYSADKTVSERVFWKYMFSKFGRTVTTVDGHAGYVTETTDAQTESIVKCIGRISSGVQRSDDSGIYNETFVQIPSSYGSIPAIFKKVTDYNYKVGDTYTSNNGVYIEGIDASTEVDPSTDTLKITGISAKGQFDGQQNNYIIGENQNLELVLDINELNDVHGTEGLSYDDFVIEGPDSSTLPTNFSFNAILVYYSLYDPALNRVLATNAFGLYLLDNVTLVNQTTSDVTSNSTLYRFPRLEKKKGTANTIGTSFSFRLNIKPTTAYTGDVTINDNSTTIYSESENFNDVIHNLSNAVSTLKSNAKLLYDISKQNDSLKNFAISAISKVNDFEHELNAIKTGKELRLNSIYQLSGNTTTPVSIIPEQLISAVTVKCGQLGDAHIQINPESITDPNTKRFARNMITTDDSGTYYDVNKLLAVLITKLKQ